MKRLVRAVLAAALFAVAAVCAAGLAYRPDLQIPSGMGGRPLEAGGVRLRVLQEGKGPDILMIHGSPGVLEDFDEQARRLRESFRVTRYDRPGHGFSGDSGLYSLEDNARVALALLDELGLERTVVVGHSYGGSTALALARMKSPRVAALVVLDSAVYTQIRPVNPMFHVLRVPALGFGLARLVPRGRREAMVGGSILGEFRTAVPPEPFLSVRTAVFAEPKVLHAIANEHTGSAGELERQSPHYREIEVPVHVVAQRDDPARRESAERLHRELPGGELLLVSPSGHYVQVEQAEEVAALIRRAAEGR